jgi:cell division protein FtsL
MKHIFLFASSMLVLSLFFTVFAHMIVANQMIVYGNDLGLINQRINELTEQNTYLSKQITKNSSIKRIAENAKLYGFVETTNYLAFDQDSYPIAIKR